MRKKKLNSIELSSLTDEIHQRDVNFHTREVYLNRWVDDEEDGIDHKVANRFIKNIHLLERMGRGKIVVHMCIGGGSWEYGMAMYDAIKLAKSPVTILTYSDATSMSGILLQAADRRIMMPHSSFMLHYGSIGFDDVPSHAASEIIRYNERSCKIMLDLFVERAMEGEYFKENKMGIRKVREFIDSNMKKKGDWYLSAHETVRFGFADGVLGHNGCRV